jgi:hypothetical protein
MARKSWQAGENLRWLSFGERIKYLARAILCVAAASLALWVPSGIAKPHTSVSWTLPHAVSEGAPISFSWRGSHLGRKHRLVVQKPEGTAHTWRTIMKLSTNSGSGELPGMPLGKYRFRIADLSGPRVLAQEVAGIGVFGQVPLATLLGTSERVYATPTNSFPYARSWGQVAEPAFTVEQNHCQSVHIAFVLGSGSYNIPGSVTTFTVVQESRDPVSASAVYNTIGSLDVELVPGQSWAVNISTKEAKAEEAGHMTTYANGYAVCDSTES